MVLDLGGRVGGPGQAGGCQMVDLGGIVVVDMARHRFRELDQIIGTIVVVPELISRDIVTNAQVVDVVLSTVIRVEALVAAKAVKQAVKRNFEDEPVVVIDFKHAGHVGHVDSRNFDDSAPVVEGIADSNGLFIRQVFHRHMAQQVLFVHGEENALQEHRLVAEIDLVVVRDLAEVGELEGPVDKPAVVRVRVVCHASTAGAGPIVVVRVEHGGPVIFAIVTVERHFIEVERVCSVQCRRIGSGNGSGPVLFLEIFHHIVAPKVDLLVCGRGR